MKLARLDMVNRHAEERKRLLHLVAVTEASATQEIVPPFKPPFFLTIDGAWMDEAMSARIRPHVIAELRARVAEIDADLARLGVTAD